MQAINAQGPVSTASGPDYPDDMWVERIRAGDEEAYEALFHAHYDDLVDFAQVRLQSREAAQEIVQSIFLAIWQQAASWRPRGSLSAYLFGAVRNKIVDHYRHRRVVRERQESIVTETAMASERSDADLQFADLKKVMLAAIEEMPERRRLVFKLARNHQLSYVEIATVLDISVNTVKKQMVRALRFLRERYAEYYPGVSQYHR